MLVRVHGSAVYRIAKAPSSVFKKDFAKKESPFVRPRLMALTSKITGVKPSVKNLQQRFNHNIKYF